MGSYRARASGWLWAAVALLAVLVPCRADQSPAQTPRKSAADAAAARATRDVRSRNFLIHTDLSQREADELVERLEVMLREISAYWGRPMQGTIECYVVRDFASFPQDAMHPVGICGIRSAGGMTLMCTAVAGYAYLAKSVVYAGARPEVVRHEAVHAYCHQTFGRIGPVWYSEGMAEMGHYWKEGDSAVRLETARDPFSQRKPAEIAGRHPLPFAGHWRFVAELRLARRAIFWFTIPTTPPTSSRLAGGSWMGKDIRFDQTYAATARELWFEYLFFLKHIGRGYRVDLCAWDWNKKFAAAARPIADGHRPGGPRLAAHRPDGRGRVGYEYTAAGNWRVAAQSQAVGANGDDHGRGRLVGVLMKDYQLMAEFEMGERGALELPAATATSTSAAAMPGMK